MMSMETEKSWQERSSFGLWHRNAGVFTPREMCWLFREAYCYSKLTISLLCFETLVSCSNSERIFSYINTYLQYHNLICCLGTLHWAGPEKIWLCALLHDGVLGEQWLWKYYIQSLI